MPVYFWVLIAVHVFLCFFLIFLVLLQNDKMGGLAGLNGMSSQAFSGAGAATFIQKLTRWVAIVLMAVVLTLSYLATKQENQVVTSDLKKAASGLGSVLPQVQELQDLPAVPPAKDPGAAPVDPAAAPAE